MNEGWLFLRVINFNVCYFILTLCENLELPGTLFKLFETETYLLCALGRGTHGKRTSSMHRFAWASKRSQTTMPDRTPRNKWIDNIVEDCQQMNISIHEVERLAYDRHKWWFMMHCTTWAVSVRRLRRRRKDIKEKDY